MAKGRLNSLLQIIRNWLCIISAADRDAGALLLLPKDFSHKRAFLEVCSTCRRRLSRAEGEGHCAAMQNAISQNQSGSQLPCNFHSGAQRHGGEKPPHAKALAIPHYSKSRHTRQNLHSTQINQRPGDKCKPHSCNSLMNVTFLNAFVWTPTVYYIGIYSYCLVHGMEAFEIRCALIPRFMRWVLLLSDIILTPS